MPDYSVISGNKKAAGTAAFKKCAKALLAKRSALTRAATAF